MLISERRLRTAQVRSEAHGSRTEQLSSEKAKAHMEARLLTQRERAGRADGLTREQELHIFQLSAQLSSTQRELAEAKKQLAALAKEFAMVTNANALAAREFKALSPRAAQPLLLLSPKGKGAKFGLLKILLDSFPTASPFPTRRAQPALSLAALAFSSFSLNFFTPCARRVLTHSEN